MDYLYFDTHCIVLYYSLYTLQGDIYTYVWGGFWGISLSIESGNIPIKKVCNIQMDIPRNHPTHEHTHIYTVEPRYNEVLGTMKITLLYQVSHYIGV